MRACRLTTREQQRRVAVYLRHLSEGSVPFTCEPVLGISNRPSLLPRNRELIR